MTGLTDSIRLLQFKMSCLFFSWAVCHSFYLNLSLHISNIAYLRTVAFKSFSSDRCHVFSWALWLVGRGRMTLVFKTFILPLCARPVCPALWRQRCHTPLVFMTVLCHEIFLFPWHDMPVLLILSFSFIKYRSLLFGLRCSLELSVYANLSRASQMCLILAFEI